jgi:hypothetical protein
MLWMLLACRIGTPAQAIPAGEWTLQGPDLAGILQVVENRCWIGLWGPGFRTGETAVDCWSIVEDERIVLGFSLEMGAGSASASAWTTPDLQQLVLPLGSRPGEHELNLTLTPGLPASPALNAAKARSEATLRASQALWERSVFRLEESGVLVGEVYLPAGGPPELQLYSKRWMTRGRVKASLVEKGPDLWLSFDLMPSLESESGLLILNRATNKAVLPLSDRPTPGEQHFSMVDGLVSAEERESAVETGMAEALKMERSVVEPIAQAVFSQAVAQGCPAWAELETLDSSWGLILKGYAVSTHREGSRCELRFEPRPIQLGRRLGIRRDGEGLESVARPLVF